MAAHLHTQIRNAAVTALTGLTTSASRVYGNRLYAMDGASLPGLRVSTDEDAVQAETVHTPHAQAHRLILVVEACAKAGNGLDAMCDQMQKEVEIALAGGLTVGSRNLYPILTGSGYDDDAAGTPAGVKRIEFAIDYFAMNNAPDALI